MQKNSILYYWQFYLLHMAFLPVLGAMSYDFCETQHDVTCLCILFACELVAAQDVEGEHGRHCIGFVEAGLAILCHRLWGG